MFWILLGITAGWISSIVLRTRETQGLLTDVILGITGAILGGLMLEIFGQSQLTGFTVYNVATALLSALALVWIGRLINPSNNTS